MGGLEEVRGKISKWIRWLEVQPADLMPQDYEDANECGANQIDSLQFPPTISATFNENDSEALLLHNSVPESFSSPTTALPSLSSTTNSLA